MIGVQASYRTNDWRTVIIIVGTGVLAACQLGKVSIALSALQSDFGINLATASWLISAFAFIGALGGSVAGFIVDRVGAKRMLIVGLIVLAAGSLQSAFASCTINLIGGRILEGVGFLAVVVAAPALIALVVTSQSRQKAMSVWAPFMPIGLTLIMLTSPMLDLVTWRSLWIGNAAVLLLYALFIALLFKGKHDGDKKPRSVLQDIGDTFRSSGPWLLGGVFCAYTAIFFTLFGFLPTYLSSQLEQTSENAGLLSAIAVGISGIGNAIGARLLAHGVAARTLLLIGFASMALCTFGIFVGAVPTVLVFVLCLLFPLLGGFIPVVILSQAPLFAPRTNLIGATMGFVMQGNNLGLLAGPAIAGWCIAYLGWAAVILPVSIFAAIGIILSITIQSDSRYRYIRR